MSSNQPSNSGQQYLNVPVRGISAHQTDSDEPGKSSFVPHDPSPPDHRRVQWPKELIPPKDANDGSWELIRYAPIWTDPDWQDDDRSRVATDLNPIKNRFMGRVRPALLARDQIWNPTEYAKRFGIFPDRIDGRSRTSPTRAESRKIFPTGNVRTGKDLFGRLEKLAAEKGQSLDEFVTKERIDAKEMHETDEACMKVYEDLLVDEHWQGLLFGDLTMDELHAEDYFTMGAAESDLQGPLHPCLRRDNWMSTRGMGQAGGVPRTVYNINGERGEYNPQGNDNVWEAMQPALQLASRLLSADHPFLSAIKDITNRFRVDDSLDHRPAEAKKLDPKFSFRSFVNMNDPSLVPAARLMRQVPHFDPTALSQTVMEVFVRLSVRSGHYHFSNKFQELATAGVTGNPGVEVCGKLIQISIAAELVWPLLEPNFSSSEKIMASYVLAVTIVHEMMHAWMFAHLKWLFNPKEFGISDPYLQDLCRQLRQELHPGDTSRLFKEPCFENDPVCEVGHAYEQHVLGGGSWPLGANMCNRVGPPFLGDFSGMALYVKRGGSISDGWLERLSYPEIRTDQYNHFLRIHDIQRYFTEEFWQNSVQRYGMAAMRNPSEKPHKVFFAPENCRGPMKTLRDSNLGTRDIRVWMTKYLDDLAATGKDTLETYFRALISESANFRLMAKRFAQDKKRRSSSGWQWLHTGKMVSILALELRARVIMLSPRSEPQKLAGLHKEYARWTKMAASARSLPDKYSENCRANLMAFLNSICSINLDDHNNRLIPRLMDLVHLLEFEREIQESMLCELYRLPLQLWVHYKRGFEGHYEFSKNQAKVVLKTLSYIMTIINYVNDFIPSWSGDWRARLQSLATAWKNIQKLLEMDPNNVCENWRDLLVTVPMLRKSRRQAYDRLFFLAKKDMLNQTGQDLENLRKFKSHLQNLVKLESYKIELPETDLDEQGLMQGWAGLLDDVMEKRASGPNLANAFNTERVLELIAKLKQQKLNAETSKWDRAKEQTARKTNKANQKRLGPTLQQKAESDAVQAPQTPAQTTRPSFPGHAVHSESFKGRSSGIPAEHPALFPAVTLSRLTRRTPAFFHRGTRDKWRRTNKPLEPRPVGGIMPHPFANRTTVTKDLSNQRLKTTETVPIGSFAHEGPREGQSILGRSGPQGEGIIGNIDNWWEQQGQEMEGVQYGQQAQEPAAADQGNAEMDVGTGVSPGAAFLAKSMLESDESASDSSMTSRSVTPASSDSTADGPDASARFQSGTELETSRLKRKGSWAAAKAFKRVKSGPEQSNTSVLACRGGGYPGLRF
ncbi:hypothetical protein EDB81DRAFT_852035 [Dactylonectria macrodidyma]|uniref:Uncharacterized protein n=1 Tax=Dactylonectria macrodidyma TaxID=307937 RepID=A0A9P9JME8_9HYPO|nr:hypothetical protein EDB81DRAFT_852035 [Dactylonectria macrodidyma]